MPEIETDDSIAFAIEVNDDRHALPVVADALVSAGARITWISILDARKAVGTIVVELADADSPQSLLQAVQALPCVLTASRKHTMEHVFGKRIVIVGGGAQVGLVAQGAISEADRHNLRGERISVDTIPLVGERAIAEAVREAARLPRVDGVVLAGALMGGEIEKAVRWAQRKGLMVISLNMAGSVPDAADLVVTDPVQAGVMAVMAVAHTAKFDLRRLGGKRF